MAADGSVLVSLHPRTRVELADPTGSVLALLRLLAEGTRDVAGLATALTERGDAVTVEEVTAAVESLDGLGWLDDAAAAPRLSDAERRRHGSNLAFFDGFSSLSRSPDDIQAALRASHVLVLGVGGLGSAVLQNLVGMGVGRLTLIDHDTIEARNIARQFVYSTEQIGLRKVEQAAHWVHTFDPTVQVTALHREVTGPDTIAALLPGVDAVVHAIDTPDDVDQWVNEACVRAGVPYVRGGLSYLWGLYWSVDPGRSACQHCLGTYRERRTAETGADRWHRVMEREPVNRALGPVATMIGALTAMEVLRYLTAIVPPVAAGTYHTVDFSTDCHLAADPWPRDPDCPVCATAPARRRPSVQEAGAVT